MNNDNGNSTTTAATGTGTGTGTLSSSGGADNNIMTRSDRTTATMPPPHPFAPAATSSSGGVIVDMAAMQTGVVTETASDNPWNVSPAVTASHSGVSGVSAGTRASSSSSIARKNNKTTTATLAASTAVNGPSSGAHTTSSGSGSRPTEGAVGGEGIATSNSPLPEGQQQQLTQQPVQQQQQQQQPLIDYPGANPAVDTSSTQNGTNAVTPQQQDAGPLQQPPHPTSPTTAAAAEASPSDHPTSPTTAQQSASISEVLSAASGGRLWKAAKQEAEKDTTTTTPSTVSSHKRSRFAESIMERTRSRADPNALVSNSNGNSTSHHGTLSGGKTSSMISAADQDTSFIINTAVAKKRVRVVQLLLIGLVGLLLGLLGNFFVSTSCHFATVLIMVGQNEKEFEFHFGLWKYSPIDSVFQGYSYCYKYDQNYAMDSPVVARIANIAALCAGLIAISILWLYLIFGYANKRRWKWAVRIAAFAGLVQLITLYFFVGQICQEYSCEFGPGAYLSVCTSVVWFVLACEMHYHTPVAQYASGYSDHYPPGAVVSSAHPHAIMDEPRSLVTTMEMSHFDDVTREYLTRVTGKTKEDEMPTLNMDLKRVRPKSGLYTPTSTNGTGLYFPSPKGTYQAPDPSFPDD